METIVEMIRTTLPELLDFECELKCIEEASKGRNLDKYYQFVIN